MMQVIESDDACPATAEVLRVAAVQTAQQISAVQNVPEANSTLFMCAPCPASKTL